MAYVKPRVEITQDFTSVPVFSEQPLSALILGPQYNLVRYGQASEKASASAVNPDGTSGNAYDNASDVTYPYPNKPAGSTVDTGYTQVYFDKVSAQYFPLSDLGSASDAVAKVEIGSSGNYYANRVRSSSLIFKTANGYDHSSVFSNRDVQAGDTVIVSDGGSNSLTTAVSNFVADVSAASVGSVTNASTNAPTQSESYDGSVTAGGSYATVTVSASGSAYVGYPSLGVVGDTYTATVTTAGNLTAVRFSVSSANSVFATKTDVALSSAVLDLDTTGDNDVSLDFTSSTSFTVGMTFSLDVTAAVTRVTPTVSGTFIGSSDVTYIGTITRGGPAYDGTNASTCAQIKFTSTSTDASGPYNLAEATAVPAGNLGLSVAFSTEPSNGSFVLGDVYTFTATAATNAQVRTLVLKDSLTSALLTASNLYIVLAKTQNDVLIPAVVLPSNFENWSADTSGVTVNQGVSITDASLVAGDNSLAQLPVLTAKVYIQHRDLLSTNTTAIQSISDPTAVESTLGPITPDNPLAQGVYLALLNAADVVVYYVAVPSDDLTGYNSALALASKSKSVYGMVPLTYDSQVQDAVISNVNAYSTPLQAAWRVAWLSKEIVTTEGLYVAQSGGGDWLATVSANTEVSGTEYTVFTVSGATFVTDAVRVNDVVRFNYETNVDGTVTYDSYVVEEVRSETTLVVSTDVGAAVTVARKFELWRPYTLDEQATNYAAVASGYNSRRVRVVFPDEVGTVGSSTTLAGYYAACALSGLRSGVAPQEGLTNVEILGFNDLSTALQFSETQLDTIAGAGVWIVTQDAVGSTPYTRHQLTTDQSSTKTAEDSLTSNVDSISYALQDVLSPFIGKYNITPESKVLIYDALNSELLFRQTETATPRGGNQLISYSIDTFAQNSTYRDRIDIGVTLDVPYPFNYAYITLTV